MNTRSPILYEVNTRVWLAELAAAQGRKVGLADVPDEEIDRWRTLGFTHVWLMGVWQVGPEARKVALQHWREKWRTEIPSREEDVHGSPYAIQEYAIDTRLGEPLDLLMLKERLSRAGIKLILDFVPNHFGVDSPEPRRYPARFVQADSPVAGTFPCETKAGRRYFAHGRDPYFPPWNDTVQVDYRVAEAHESMSLIAQTISMFGDGLRCDMAMLVLPEIFAETWKDFASVGAHPTAVNFWQRAIPQIRQLQPQVDLIAEAYWDREQALQDIGFDFTYNKRVTDYIMRGQNRELAQFLATRTPAFLRRSVHFLENHDEARAAAALNFRRHQAAAALVLFLPGMALLHDGQLEGRRSFSPIQVSRRTSESPDPELQRFYHGLLTLLPATQVRRGTPELIPQIEDEAVVIQWQGRDGQADAGIVNLTARTVEARLSLKGASSRVYSTAEGLTLAEEGVWKVPPESAHIVRYLPM